MVRNIPNKYNQQMLLDEYMNGFIFALFVTKWKQFAMKVWMFKTAVDIGFVVVVTILASPSLITTEYRVRQLLEDQVLPGMGGWLGVELLEMRSNLSSVI